MTDNQNMTNTNKTESDTVNPHLVPAEYTELACLIGFVLRVAERSENASMIALCDRAQTGHPTAIAKICWMAASLTNRCVAPVYTADSLTYEDILGALESGLITDANAYEASAKNARPDARQKVADALNASLPAGASRKTSPERAP